VPAGDTHLQRLMGEYTWSDMIKALANSGAAAVDAVWQTGRTFLRSLIVVAGPFTPPYMQHPLLRQVQFIGARSLGVIVVYGRAIGLVMGLQFYNILERFGSVDLLGSAVALAVIRELGPVVTALMVVGRAGSAICAELGIMRITEQVDALECMAIRPDKFLVAPKLVGGLLSVPLLTFVFCVVAIFGGYFVGVVMFGVAEGSYLNGMREAVLWEDIRLCLVKSVIFGLLL